MTCKNKSFGALFNSKMMHSRLFIIAVITVVLWLAISSCRKDVPVPIPKSTHLPQVPGYFPEQHYDNPLNPITIEGVELGRKLFYDKTLSKTGEISCASCHKQSAAFSDPGKALSTGIKGRTGLRNSPALFNLAWHPGFNWDGGINHIEVQPIAPIQDSAEMGEKLLNVVLKIGARSDYQESFKKVFDTDTVTDKYILYAFAQFMSAMISADAKYDRVQQNKAVFTESEKRGLQLFEAQCASCHKPPLFSDFSYRNNGIEIQNEDYGRYGITSIEADKGKFKVPSLRNINLTPPYMHDGRFENLDEVLNHYTTNERYAPDADTDLPQNLELSKAQKADLKAFLGTLTDYNFIENPLFSDPRQ